VHKISRNGESPSNKMALASYDVHSPYGKFPTSRAAFRRKWDGERHTTAQAGHCQTCQSVWAVQECCNNL